MSQSALTNGSWARAATSIALLLALAGASLVAFAPSPVAGAAAPPYFGANVHVNGNPAYYASQPSLAVGSNGVVYLAFAGYSGATTAWDVYFSKSSDGGRTWTTEVRVNSDAGNAGQGDPDIALGPNDDIYIVWTDSRGGTNDVYLARSTDGGLSFPSNVRVNDVTTFSQDSADIVVDRQGVVHVVWTDYRNLFSTGPDIYYADSTDGGLSFNPNRRVNNDAPNGEQVRPAIAVANDRTLYAVWDDPQNAGRGRDIYLSKSTDFGATWQPDLPVNDDTGNVEQREAAIAVDEAGTIYLAWTDYRSPTAPDIYASRSTTMGSTFAANVKVNDDVGIAAQFLPQLAVRSGQVVAIWTDGRTTGTTSNDIYMASSEDGITWGPDVRVNDDFQNNHQTLPTVGLNAAGDVFAAFFDQRTTGNDVYAATLDVVAPAADAGSDVTVDQGVPVSFDGSASADNFAIASYGWDFGDGTTASGATASHAYTQPGSYVATLTVSDYSGNVHSDTILVTVRDTIAPVANGGGDRVVDEDQPIYFDGSASTDNVGVVSYQWDFGDGTSSTDSAVTHVYDRPGAYTVTLTVEDAAGNSDAATITVTVRTVSPKAGELLGMIQGLQMLVVLLAIALAVVGYIAFAMWRRRPRQPAYSPPAAPIQAPPSPPPEPAPPEAPASPPPRETDPLDLPFSEERPRGP